MAQFKSYALLIPSLIILSLGVYGFGYSRGYKNGVVNIKNEMIQAVIVAQQNREEINHETDNLDSVALCVALGGLREQCANILRGLDEAADNQ